MRLEFDYMPRRDTADTVMLLAVMKRCKCQK
jgi:hypothetical protein